MDFGKWISSGVTYANTKHEESLRRKYLPSEEEDKPDASTSPPAIVLTRASDIEFRDRNITALNEFLC